jgi:methyl-accepting chemotaxis protein
MDMSEQPEEEKQDDSMFKSLGKWTRYGLAGLGVAASVLGLALIVLVYLTVSPQISIVRDASVVQFDNAASTLGDLDASLAGVYDSLKLVPEFSENLSIGLSGFAASTGKLADGIDSLATKTAELGVNADSFRSASASLRASTDALNGQADSLSEISSSIAGSQKGIKKARDDLAKAKSDLSKTKRDIAGVFDSISTALIMVCVMFALVFIALGAYSVALFL